MGIVVIAAAEAAVAVVVYYYCQYCYCFNALPRRYCLTAQATAASSPGGCVRAPSIEDMKCERARGRRYPRARARQFAGAQRSARAGRPSGPARNRPAECGGPVGPQGFAGKGPPGRREGSAGGERAPARATRPVRRPRGRSGLLRRFERSPSNEGETAVEGSGACASRQSA